MHPARQNGLYSVAAVVKSVAITGASSHRTLLVGARGREGGGGGGGGGGAEGNKHCCCITMTSST